MSVAALAGGFGPGRLCRNQSSGPHKTYGKELIVARREPDGRLRPQDWISKKLQLSSGERFTDTEFLATAPLLDLGGAQPLELVARGPMVALRLDLAGIPVTGVADAHQRTLLDPPRRRVQIATETAYGNFQPRPGTPAHAWRKLGLLDATGTPTARGRIFNRFQAGEGLLVAAALEDPTYDVTDIVRHLANLRGGHRFHDHEGASDQLAVASRAAYGHVDYEGYLRAGVCESYGEGTWEALERHMAGRLAETDDLRRGDLERAALEWQSLLRHVIHAPDARAPRWTDLQAAAAEVLARSPYSTTRTGVPHGAFS